jgi:hypothetical protein
MMSDFVWRFVSVVNVSVLAVVPFVLIGDVRFLVAGLMVGGGAVLALLQIGRE